MEDKLVAKIKRRIQSGNDIDTPCYVYDRQKILKNIAILKKNFTDIARLYFAVKANTNLTILKLIKDQGIGAEVVSPGEIFICKKAGFKGNEILYNNVARKSEEIYYALKSGVEFFNFESINQAILLEQVAKEMGKCIKVFVRINPGIFPETHPHLSTGSTKSKFGIKMEELSEVLRIIKKFRYAKLVGIHSHIGSQILSPEPFIKASRKVVEAIEFFKKNRIKIDFVNLGGGFGVPYRPEEKDLDFSPIVDCYRQMKQRYNLEVLLEPGRFFVANGGYILTRLIDKKMRNHLPVYMIDAGMTENPRPALYDAYHHIEPLFKYKGRRLKVRVTGPLCENADEFGVFNLPELKIGDYLLIHNSGAYTRTMASTYNGRPLPQEYLIDGGIKLIRKKQSLKELIANE
ncbi:MAG: diaminopimelate decarboxylase [candidate division WOR-3 bacterium]|nr:diaminopimelate decarboxylase [candidate division WOR-3 bacterium]